MTKRRKKTKPTLTTEKQLAEKLEDLTEEMEATWKRVAEERLREIEQLRSDDTDLREDLEASRKMAADNQQTALMALNRAENAERRVRELEKEATTEANNLQRMKEALVHKNGMLANEIDSLKAQLREAKSRVVPYNPFRPGCE